MAFVNYITKNIAVKIVYYGPGLSGKTTNLRYIYFKLDPKFRGEFICLETESERTFFFDMLPIKAGLIGEYEVHFQLMTVPGQVFYEASRRSVIRGADGIVFVADSQAPLLDTNLESFDGLRKNCLDFNINLDDIPLVFQYNKRDLANLIPVETLNALLNPRKHPYVEAAAINGVGVFETLREIAKLAVPRVKEAVLGEKGKVAEKGKKKTEEEIFAGPKKEREERRAVEPAPGLSAEKGDMTFSKPGQPPPFEEKKIKVKSKKDIETELDKLSEEFVKKSK